MVVDMRDEARGGVEICVGRFVGAEEGGGRMGKRAAGGRGGGMIGHCRKGWAVGGRG